MTHDDLIQNAAREIARTMIGTHVGYYMLDTEKDEVTPKIADILTRYFGEQRAEERHPLLGWVNDETGESVLVRRTQTSSSPDVTKMEPMPVMDWQQVVLNGGPPCFATGPGERWIDGRLRYCGRSERWAGHDGSDHPFVSLDDLLNRRAAASPRVEEPYDVRFHRLRQANSLLRSALTIAKREGAQTNWKAFAAQIEHELEAAHAILYPSAEARVEEKQNEEER